MSLPVCAGSNVCKANYQCPGGSTCGTNCNPGYTNNGTDCIRTPNAPSRACPFASGPAHPRVRLSLAPQL